MQISPHVEALQRQLLSAAAAGGPEAEELAGRLAVALDAAARLAILDALTDAAGEITRELAPGSIDVRLRGRDVEFAVTSPAAIGGGMAQSAPSRSTPTAPTTAPSSTEAAAGDDAEDAATSRTTLRLPDALKSRAEAAAANEGISLNAWLVRAVSASLESKQDERQQGSSQYAGWVR